MIQEIEFILYVADQKKSKDFYSFVLDLDPSLDVEGMTEFIVGQNCKLGLMPENGIAKILTNKTPHPKAGNGIPRCEIYLKIDNCEEYFSRAVDAGGKIISKFTLRDWGDKVAYISDPDGHIIAFAEKNRS